MMTMDNTKELMMEYTLSEQRRGQLERLLSKALKIVRHSKATRRRLMEYAKMDGNKAEEREWEIALVEQICFEDMLIQVLAGDEASLDRTLSIYE